MTWQVSSLEGNTNQAASRTGGEVARLRRSSAHSSEGYIAGFGMPRYDSRHSVEKMLDTCRSQLGYVEGPDNHTKYGVEYGMDHASWCDIFQSVMGLHAFGSYDVVGKFAYTPSHVDWFKKMGRWHSTPLRGALGFVFYNSLGRVGHVFIVEDTTWLPGWYQKSIHYGDRGPAVGVARSKLGLAHAGEWTKPAGQRCETFLANRGFYPSPFVGADAARAMGD